MPLKLIKLLFAAMFAGHLLKANRVRSTAQFSRAGWAMLFTAVKDSFNKMLAAIQKLEDNELRRKYYGAAGKLADSVKNIAEAGE